MKKFFFFAALAALAFTACNKSGSLPETPPQKAQLRFSISAAALGETRAAPVEANEVRVNTIDAFVFNATGDLDAYGHYTSSDFTTDEGNTTLNSDKKLACSAGSGKAVWIVINGDGSNVTGGGYASGIKTVTDLESQVFLLSQNARGTGTQTLDNFQMIGSKTQQKLLPGDNTVSVQVSRPVARVWIKKISKHFASAAQASALTVKNIYMSNVVGSCRYDGGTKVTANDLWHNKYTPATGAITIDNAMNLWLNRNLAAAGVSIAEGTSATTDVESTFYVMPNSVPWGTGSPATYGPVGGDTWTPRHTNLVIETEYAGKTYYYSIPVAGNGDTGYPIGKDGDTGSDYQGLLANYSYEINELVLTRLGTTSPDEPVLPAMVNVQITVKPWTALLMANNDDSQYVI